MLIFINIIDFTAVDLLLLGIPESIGLLAFGVGLTATAVIIRWFLGRSDAEKSKESMREVNLAGIRKDER